MGECFRCTDGERRSTRDAFARFGFDVRPTLPSGLGTAGPGFLTASSASAGSPPNRPTRSTAQRGFSVALGGKVGNRPLHSVPELSHFQQVGAAPPCGLAAAACERCRRRIGSIGRGVPACQGTALSPTPDQRPPPRPGPRGPSGRGKAEPGRRRPPADRQPAFPPSQSSRGRQSASTGSHPCRPPGSARGHPSWREPSGR